MQNIGCCPNCFHRVVINITIDLDGTKANWHQCQCGTWFKAVPNIDKKVFNEEYKNNYIKVTGIKECLAYQRKVYMPLISELTKGRRILDVGFTIPLNIEAWKADGWVAEGIDLIKDDNPNTFIGDFEKFEFKKQYDVIWFADVVQSFNDPLPAIFKAYGLLKPDGLLFITAPSPGIIHEVGYRDWGNWDNVTNNVYFSKENMIKILERMGMEVIVKWENLEPRFNAYKNYHILAQRVYGAMEGQDNGTKDNVTDIKSLLK